MPGRPPGPERCPGDDRSEALRPPRRARPRRWSRLPAGPGEAPSPRPAPTRAVSRSRSRRGRGPLRLRHRAPGSRPDRWLRGRGRPAAADSPGRDDSRHRRPGRPCPAPKAPGARRRAPHRSWGGGSRSGSPRPRRPARARRRRRSRPRRAMRRGRSRIIRPAPRGPLLRRLGVSEAPCPGCRFRRDRRLRAAGASRRDRPHRREAP